MWLWRRKEQGTQYISRGNNALMVVTLKRKLDSSSIVSEWRVQLGLPPAVHMLVISKSIETFVYYICSKGVTLPVLTSDFASSALEASRWASA